jgi:hypothetical protein
VIETWGKIELPATWNTENCANPPNEFKLAGKKPYGWDTKTLIENFLGKNKPPVTFLHLNTSGWMRLGLL